MPDHIHGIIILPDTPVGIAPVGGAPVGGAIVGTLHATSLQSADHSSSHHSGISPKPGSIAAIVRSYKSAVSKYAHRLGYDFSWQSRFHDRIIRDENEFNNITNYIRNNPTNWGN